MFTIPDDKVTFVKENGLYDYLLDMEAKRKINKDDKEDIYQYILVSSVDHMSSEEYSKFVDGLIAVLNQKKECEIAWKAEKGQTKITTVLPPDKRGEKDG